MFALDTNILVYAHNEGATHHSAAKEFLQKIMNSRDEEGNLLVCLPVQVLLEFINTITWTRLEAPLSLEDACLIAQDYLDSGIHILHPKSTHLETTLQLLQDVSSRKKVFDIALAATLKDHEVSGLYTVNVKDFRDFNFLEIQNPLV